MIVWAVAECGSLFFVSGRNELWGRGQWVISTDNRAHNTPLHRGPGC